MKNLVSRKELEEKAIKISEESDIDIRVRPVKGDLNIEMVDKELKKKKVFTGDIRECNLFIEGLLAFIEVQGTCQEAKGR